MYSCLYFSSTKYILVIRQWNSSFVEVLRFPFWNIRKGLPLHLITQCLPKSLYSFRSTFALRKIHKYVVCSKCSVVYTYADSKDNNSSKLCSFVRFPNHPHRQKRLACGAPLLKTVELASQKRILYPYLTYCYISIQESLQKLLLQPLFF